MNSTRLLVVTFALASITVFMGTQEVFAVTVIDANDIPAPSQTVDFSQFTGDFSADCPDFFAQDFCFTDGPIQVGDLVFEDIIWSSTSANSVIGNGFYGLSGGDDNGNWTPARNGYVGTNAGSDTVIMRFDFNDGAVCAVGGFVNYARGDGDPFVMKALDNGNAVLESFDVSNDAPIITPGASDDGAFRGFVRASNDIASIELTGEFDVLDDLKFARCDTVVVGGELIPIESTSLILAGAQTFSWMIPVVLSVIGIGLFVVSRKPENS